MKLILASQNSGKQAEMRALLGHLSIELLIPQDFNRLLNIAETGSSYAENALLKARAYVEAFGHWTLGDDTGLEVVALEGAPGLHSARFVGSGGTDEDRRRHLLGRLEAHARPWRARFVSVLALVSPQGEAMLRQGECLGEIVPHARGKWGFGYDPIFQVDGTEKTMAELAIDEKNRVSHRALAVKAIIPEIEQLLKNSDT
jgi:XTP/dITP diphosphohydrolase